MSLRSALRQSGVAVRALIAATLVLGVGYTALITGVGQLALPAQANGSLVTDAAGAVVGSALIGQSFTEADGAALPQYFQSRPSAAGDGYDASASSGSNLGPENPDLLASIAERRQAVAELEGVDPASVPVDALTASGSGLDPHISPAYAALQVARVARARGLDEGEVRALVAAHTTGPDLGYLGEPRVNVLELNLALDALAP
ncbi:potassium-transporting ATPase subunit KdpC [Microbacterium sp. SORGH_AS_0862]|uniref:potassium-transporting ATPase subunit KdpC n=1 Tax=Microbacterium sp. SORGH_AS_0862 TaxID=3041789 RepID=UPI00278F0257|nr:potassium-transporting ATPase subunit KdpC [Microbacterium sp. SORGH_AS_0862]MDQ1204564.1 K+-transporting ATPase ATPase C chain [Microbacterium sp. SORGH_AS_0862]